MTNAIKWAITLALVAWALAVGLEWAGRQP
jgi:hypothetical protein